MTHRRAGRPAEIWVKSRKGPRLLSWEPAIEWMRQGKIPGRAPARLAPDEPWRPIHEIPEVREELSLRKEEDAGSKPEARRFRVPPRLFIPLAAGAVLLGLALWMWQVVERKAEELREFEARAEAELVALRGRIAEDLRSYKAEIEEESNTAEAKHVESLEAAREEHDARLRALREPHAEKLERKERKFDAEEEWFQEWHKSEGMRSGRLAAERREREWAERSTCNSKHQDGRTEERARRLYLLARDGKTPAESVLQEIVDGMCVLWEDEEIDPGPDGLRLKLKLDLTEVDIDLNSVSLIEARTLVRETRRDVANTLKRILWLAGPHRPVFVEVQVVHREETPVYVITLDKNQIGKVEDWSRIGWERVLQLATVRKNELDRYGGFVVPGRLPR